MALTTKTLLGSHSFDGPYIQIEQLSANSGVYLITTLASNGMHTIIDVGESHNIRERISNHDRRFQWQNHQQNGIYAWVFITNESNRILVEKAHRLTYSPVCGDR